MKNVSPIELILISAVIVIAASQIYLFTLLGGTPQTNLTPLPSAGAEEIPDQIELSAVVRPVAGVVTAVEGSSIRVEAMDGSQVEVPVERDTKIYRAGERKSAAQLDAELAQFRTLATQTRNEPSLDQQFDMFLAPSPFEEIPISLTEVRVGDHISAFRTDAATVRILVHTSASR